MKRLSTVILTVLLILLLLCIGVMSVLMRERSTEHSRTERELRQALNDAQSSGEAEADALARLKVELTNVIADRDETAAALHSLEQKLDGAKDDALLLEGEREDLIEQIGLLRVALAEREANVAALEADIAQYNHVYSIDVRAQADAIHEIITMLEEGAPLHRMPKVDEDDKPIAPPEDREVVREDDDYYYVYPHLSIYYEDLTTGYHLAYNETDSFYSASLIKAPYLLWLLETISREETAAIARAEADAAETTAPAETTGPAETTAPPAPETTTPPTTTADPVTTAAPVTTAPEETTAPAETTKPPKAALPYPEREEMRFEDERYDLSRIFTYTEEAKREGSGVIQHESEGSEYTYRELCELAITKSDNVAFGELRRVFGYSDFYAFNTRLRVNSVRQNFNRITAADMAIYLRYMYDFIEEDERYGATFGEWLRNSAHGVMIPYAVHPTKSAHKYGWDENAYHDAAIVYHEHPYILVVLTDLDEGSTEVNDYIRTLVKKVNTLHKKFYQ